MLGGLRISIMQSDPDCLALEIHAWNGRYAGTTYVYAGLSELSDLASMIAGFPSQIPDERTYEFGKRDRRFAGGYCALRVRTIDGWGHAVVEVDIEDDDRLYSLSSARFSVPVVDAAAVDRFVERLRAIEAAGRGAAVLGEQDE